MIIINEKKSKESFLFFFVVRILYFSFETIFSRKLSTKIFVVKKKIVTSHI